jgi:iron-sulfur cluster repair protein YtfE (RIC family)
MLITIGKRRGAAEGDLVDLLLACHARIRKFAALAVTVAQRQDFPGDEVAEACVQVHRYFSEALPLHVADEDESILPRLQGASPEIDHALQTMRDQHVEHGPKLRSLLRLTEALRVTSDAAAWKSELAVVADDLEQELHAHLAMEESILFPALRGLPGSIQAEIVTELRERRG